MTQGHYFHWKDILFQEEILKGKQKLIIYWCVDQSERFTLKMKWENIEKTASVINDKPVEPMNIIDRYQSIN